MDTQNLDIALWDIDEKRTAGLKDRLDMFSHKEKGITIIPVQPKPPIQSHDVVFMSFDEVTEPVQDVARTVRQSGESTFIMLVSDKNRDLTPCFRPTIRPSGVMFRPVQNSEIRDILEEIADEMVRLNEEETGDVFVFKSEGISRRIPLKEILFFEASNKKISIHTVGKEIGFYDTIENISSQLPHYFVRCHRSFIVNSRKVEAMKIAEMELILTGGYRVSFSRSYRDVIKQVISGEIKSTAEV